MMETEGREVALGSETLANPTSSTYSYSNPSKLRSSARELS